MERGEAGKFFHTVFSQGWGARGAWGLFFLGAMTFLSGCVYLRLLQVKTQLQSFDSFIELGGAESLLIRFKTPVLYDRDARFLIGADPIAERNAGDGSVWHYEFEQVHRSTGAVPPLHFLTLDLHVRDGYLIAIEVPPSFLQLFPRQVLSETLRQSARADVNKWKKIASATLTLTPPADAKLPTRDRTVFLLGRPLEITEEEGLEVLHYRYRILPESARVPIHGQLSFSSDGLLRRVFITWDTSSIDARYVRSQ